MVRLLLLTLASTGYACPREPLEWLPHSYATPSEALQAVQAAFAEPSARTDTEIAGAIVARGTRFVVSAERGCRGHDQIRFRLPSRSVALWHTHGRPTAFSHVFSEHDAAVVRTTGLPFFLVAEHAVRVLDGPSLRRGLVRVRGSLRRVAGYRGRPYPIASFRQRFDQPVRSPVAKRPAYDGHAPRDGLVDDDPIAPDALQDVGSRNDAAGASGQERQDVGDDGLQAPTTSAAAELAAYRIEAPATQLKTPRALHSKSTPQTARDAPPADVYH